MESKPFHHGNLRMVLLQQAEVMLREGSVEGLSLRELARQAGVSHGAPRSHFIDRQALLDALAEQGFNRFTDKLAGAARTRGSLEERSRLIGRAYVDFAVENPALMDLMFAVKMDTPAGPVHDAAMRLFQVLNDALNPPDSLEQHLDDEAVERFKLLFAATMQGTAALMTARRITHSQAEGLIDDAVAVLLASELGARVLPRP